MHIFNNLLIVASSGRMLAQAAFAIGLRPLVLDCFADRDTQRYAEKVYQIPSLAKEHVMPVVEALINRYAVEVVIYGSGFEYYPKSLGYLAERFVVLGNTPSTFERILNKAHFFSVLDSLSILYPEVMFSPPVHKTDPWLIKPMQGQGGVGIKYYQAHDAEALSVAAIYWQKYQAGTQHSVLFLADRERAHVIGFNRQWSISLGENQAFMFSGIMHDTLVPYAQKALIRAWLDQLVAAFGLIGLNSLDFILSDGRCYVLEINSRPSASMQLYAPAWFDRHIQVCAGETLAEQQLRRHSDKDSGQHYTAYQIVYAAQAVAIPEGLVWPDGCMDLPPAGAIIGTMQPICSMIAYHHCAEQAVAMLHARQQRLLHKLTQGV
jgi:methenyltetrahydromethanopterin cyclohydrolase